MQRPGCSRSKIVRCSGTCSATTTFPSRWQKLHGEPISAVILLEYKAPPICETHELTTTECNMPQVDLASLGRIQHAPPKLVPEKQADQIRVNCPECGDKVHRVGGCPPVFKPKVRTVPHHICRFCGYLSNL
jgi:hypothetical protein